MTAQTEALKKIIAAIPFNQDRPDNMTYYWSMMMVKATGGKVSLKIATVAVHSCMMNHDGSKMVEFYALNYIVTNAKLYA